jgi:uncharacterized protein YjbI with pentapeptide repeats
MTDLQRHGKPLRILVDGEEGPREADLAGRSLSEFFRGDLLRYQFTGTIPPLPNLKVVNFVECVLHDVEATKVDFSECDFKDCIIRNCTFRDCTFDGNSFSIDFISDTTFERATFFNSGAHGCEFRNVTFVECDLTNLLMKSSKFVRCRFVACKTSNKVMEMSRLDDVTFERTDIQIDTITNNFGLTASDLVDARVRTGRPRDEHRLLTAAELAGLSLPNLSDIERVRLAYFINPDFTHGSEALDSALDVTRWTRTYKNPSSFIELFEAFAEFLVRSFERDRVTLQTILLLHHVTNTLSSARQVSPEVQRVSIAIGGVHLLLSRMVEDFLELIERLTEESGGSLRLILEGPLDASYYERELNPWLGDEVKITSVAPYNSVEAILTSVGAATGLKMIISMVLATRTQIELRHIRTALDTRETSALAIEGRAKKGRRSKRRTSKSDKLVSVQVKDLVRGPYSHELRVQALLPWNLLLDLKINFGTRKAGALRQLVRSLRVA